MKNSLRRRYHLFFSPLLLVMFLFLPSLQAQEKRQVEILNSDYMEFDRNIGSGVVKYVGDVAFKQEDMLLYCDSAWFFSEENIVLAYDSVHIIQADTLHLYGDILKYYGNEKLAEVRENVTLIDKETVLTTDHLDFDLESNVGYYEHHGHLVNGDNTLDSERGYYYSNIKTVYFMDSVVIVNPDYDIYADTLRYNTVTEVAHFLGPTEILSPDNYIYCENGWYDTKNNISQFNENAYLESSGQYLSGDSLYYERDLGMGKAFESVELYDSASNVILRGKYAIYFEEPEYAMLTDSTLLIQISDEDSLFVHADTLTSVSVKDTLKLSTIIKTVTTVIIPDTLGSEAMTDSLSSAYRTDSLGSVMIPDTLISAERTDTLRSFTRIDTVTSVVITDSIVESKILRAYYRVKIFSKDMQGKCDSLSYLQRDSVFQLMGEPVLWSKRYQLTAEQIDVHMAYDDPDYIDLTSSSFIVSQDDSIRFTQIKGRNMKGFFKEGALTRLDVNGNGQTIYYARDEAELIGVNKAESSNIKIYFEEGELNRINMMSTPTAVLYPPNHLLKEELILSGFIWLEEHRPWKMEDIFKWKE
ncbi:OstA-like protein [Bacteroidota bacterium]